uniref:Glycosyltransferase n=1 Tax=Cannabis sativa TaxID=3483 RepID=A0A803Q631_CANSA
MIIQDLSSLQQNDMSFVPFSDGYDNGLADVADFDYYRAELSRLGSLALAELIAQKSYKCLVYTLGLPWVADVAAEQNIPVALLWVQAAVVFDFGKIDEGSNPKILVNTFDELEKEALSSIVGKNLSLIGIGPLVSCNRSLSFDVNDVVLWLNSKKKTTVVYVCFGSIVVLSKAQMEEIGKGLLGFGFPFIWVIREKKVKNDNEIVENDNDEELSCREELEKLGMIVPWCSQIEVLSNESIGCFVTHCGWNSTLEGLVSGVPMVAFPQWVDQTTNAKLIENVWKVGARVKPNEEGIVEGGEIKRCLELVMGLGGKENGVENGEEIRRNSKKWKDLAKEAIMVGGSSHKNLKALISEVSGEVVDNAFSSKV